MNSPRLDEARPWAALSCSSWASSSWCWWCCRALSRSCGWSFISVKTKQIKNKPQIECVIQTSTLSTFIPTCMHRAAWPRPAYALISMALSSMSCAKSSTLVWKEMALSKSRWVWYALPRLLYARASSRRFSNFCQDICGHVMVCNALYSTISFTIYSTVIHEECIHRCRTDPKKNIVHIFITNT